MLVQHTAQAARVGELSARQLANAANGAVHTGRNRWLCTLLPALQTVAEWCMDDFNVQELANTAWAFASAGQPAVLLFVALATAAEQHIGDFKVQNLANTA